MERFNEVITFRFYVPVVFMHLYSEKKHCNPLDSGSGTQAFSLIMVCTASPCFLAYDCVGRYIYHHQRRLFYCEGGKLF